MKVLEWIESILGRASRLRLGMAVGLAFLFLSFLLCGMNELAARSASYDSSHGERPDWTAMDVSRSSPGIYGSELCYGILEPTTLDPHASDSPEIVGQVFEGLFAFDQDLNLVPAIAASWETTDAQVFTFTLRSDVYFHNGRQLTAHDVVYSWERLDPDVISDVTAVNSTTLSVTLDYPKIQWLYELPMLPYFVVPSETIATIGQHPIGSGPFRFDSWTPGVAITLTANADYYAGRPYLDRVGFSFYADEDAMYAAFQAGELDLSRVPGQAIPDLIGDPGLILHTEAGFEWVWMTLDLTPTSQIAVRRALNYATDPQAVISGVSASVPGYYPQADSIVLPGMQGYDPVLSNAYHYDPSLALDLLYSAGYTDTAPGDGVLDDGRGADLTIELWTNSENAARETAVRLLAEEWRDIGGSGVGLSVTTVFTDLGSFVGNVLGRKIPSYFLGLKDVGLEPFDALDDSFRTGAFFNLTGYSDAQVDAWLDQSMATIHLAQRHALYQQIEERILGDAPVMPLWYRGDAYVKADCVYGLAIPLYKDIPLEKVHRCGVYLPVVFKNHGP